METKDTNQLIKGWVPMRLKDCVIEGTTPLGRTEVKAESTVDSLEETNRGIEGVVTFTHPLINGGIPVHLEGCVIDGLVPSDRTEGVVTFTHPIITEATRVFTVVSSEEN